MITALGLWRNFAGAFGDCAGPFCGLAGPDRSVRRSWAFDDLEVIMILRHALLAAACLAISPAQGGQSAPTLEMSADGEIQIGVDGHVSDYRLQSKLPETLARLIDHDVRGWRFEPVLVNGVPVVAKTAMHLDLKAEPAANDSYTMRIANVAFGEPRRSHDHERPPVYPDAAVAAHLGAKVLLYVRLDETGKVVEVQPYQTSLDARASSENEAEHWRKMFEKASVTAARSWRFDLSETVNGRPIGTTAIVPIVYNVVGAGTQKPGPGEWKPYLPGPIHPAPWIKSEQVADNRDLSALRDGQALSLDTRFRLKDDVIGKTL